MKYIYTYYGATINHNQFTKNVPLNWEEKYNEMKGYSWGGYKANKI